VFPIANSKTGSNGPKSPASRPSLSPPTDEIGLARQAASEYAWYSPDWSRYQARRKRISGREQARAGESSIFLFYFLSTLKIHKKFIKNLKNTKQIVVYFDDFFFIRFSNFENILMKN
jgi:hypothetical protein